jgi:hypothetical protein
MGAWMRGDFELALIRYAPDAVLTAEARTGVRLDFELSYRGPDGVRAFIRTYQDAFGDKSYEPKWLVDLGDSLLVMLLQHSLRGRASGVEVEQVECPPPADAQRAGGAGGGPRGSRARLGTGRAGGGP